MNPNGAKAFGIALRLFELTQSDTAVTTSECGRLHISTYLPEHLDGEAQLAVLDVLYDGDRCGHNSLAGHQSVWVELDHKSP